MRVAALARAAAWACACACACACAEAASVRESYYVLFQPTLYGEVVPSACGDVWPQGVGGREGGCSLWSRRRADSRAAELARSPARPALRFAPAGSPERQLTDTHAPSSDFTAYDFFIMSPQNVTRADLDKLRGDLKAQGRADPPKVLLYMDFLHIPIDYGCSKGHVMGDREVPLRNCSWYPCGEGEWTRAINATFKREWALRAIEKNGEGSMQASCNYPGLSDFVWTQPSAKAMLPLVVNTVKSTGFDGVYMDGAASDDAVYQIFSRQFDKGQFDFNGDGVADSSKDMATSIAIWGVWFVEMLRAQLGPDAFLLANSGGPPISVTALNGVTIESEACRDDFGMCEDTLQVMSQLGAKPPMGAFWLTHSEQVSPEKQCEQAQQLTARWPDYTAGIGETRRPAPYHTPNNLGPLTA